MHRLPKTDALKAARSCVLKMSGCSKHNLTPAAKKRVVLLGQVEIRQRLVGTDVQGPEVNGLILEIAQHIFIYFKLLLLGRHAVAGHVQELGPEKPHKVREPGVFKLFFFSGADVQSDVDPGAVLCKRLLIKMLFNF